MTGQAPQPVLTDRAKRVMQRAQEEQKRLGHPRLSAEHVLLALLGDRRGMSAFVLRELAVKEAELAEKVRVELERAAPHPVVDEDAVLRAARHWAADLKQVSVGTEHLLLALIASGGAAGRFLEAAGVSTSGARATTERLFLTVRRRSGEIEPPLG